MIIINNTELRKRKKKQFDAESIMSRPIRGDDQEEMISKDSVRKT